MANDSIDIKEDAAPTKKLASQSFTRTGPGTVHQEEVVIGDGTTDGRIATVTAASALKVDGSAVTQPVSDAGAALTVDALDLDIRNLAPATDEVKVTGAAADGAAVAGNPVLIAGQDGANVQTLKTDATGELQVDVLSSALPTGAATAALQLPDGHNVTVDNAGAGAAVNIQDGGNSITIDGTVTVTQATAANLQAEVQGAEAHDAAVGGNPVLVGGMTETPADSAPANRVSAEGDVARIALDPDGSAFVLPHGPQVWSMHFDGSTAQTDLSVHAAPGAGLSLYVTDIVISKDAATALNVFFEEGASKVLGPYYLEAVAGRGLAIQFRTPKKITANTALTVTTSAAIAHAVDVTGYVGRG